MLADYYAKEIRRRRERLAEQPQRHSIRLARQDARNDEEVAVAYAELTHLVDPAAAGRKQRLEEYRLIFLVLLAIVILQTLYYCTYGAYAKGVDPAAAGRKQRLEEYRLIFLVLLAIVILQTLYYCTYGACAKGAVSEEVTVSGSAVKTTSGIEIRCDCLNADHTLL